MDDDGEGSVADTERVRCVAVWEETNALVAESRHLDPTVCWDHIEKHVRPPREMPTPAVQGPSLPHARPLYQRVTVTQRDCIAVALEVAAASTAPPVLMDAASRGHFGGGYENGARAQEEELCRRSNLAHCMDPQHGFTRVLYPLEPTACIYVPSVQFFRAGAEDDYAVHVQDDGRTVRTTTLAVGIVAATRNPVLVSGKLRPDIAENTQEAVANFLHCARIHGHKDVVVVPLGCGAYHNPPGHIAKIFDAALSQTLPDGTTLGDCFDRIIFSVLDFPTGQTQTMTNNFPIFAHYFGSRGARVLDCTGRGVDYRTLDARPGRR